MNGLSVGRASPTVTLVDPRFGPLLFRPLSPLYASAVCGLYNLSPWCLVTFALFQRDFCIDFCIDRPTGARGGQIHPIIEDLELSVLKRKEAKKKGQRVKGGGSKKLKKERGMKEKRDMQQRRNKKEEGRKKKKKIWRKEEKKEGKKQKRKK